MDKDHGLPVPTTVEAQVAAKKATSEWKSARKAARKNAKPGEQTDEAGINPAFGDFGAAASRLACTAAQFNERATRSTGANPYDTQDGEASADLDRSGVAVHPSAPKAVAAEADAEAAAAAASSSASSATSSAGADMEAGSVSALAEAELARIMAEQSEARLAGQGSEQPRVVSVPHTKKSSVPKRRQWRDYLSLEQLNAENIKRQYGITLGKNDRIDLEHTSCESSSGSEDGADERSALRSAASRSEALRSVAADQNDADAIESELADASAQSLVPQRTTAYDKESALYHSDDSCRAEFDRTSAHMKRARKERRIGRGRSADELSIERASRPSVASDVGRVTGCFRCMWGNGALGAVNNAHMATLLKLIYSNIGDKPLKAIALSVHRYYTRVMRPAARAAGQFLPKWRSKDILICLLTHNQNPVLRLARDLEKYSIIQSALELKLAYWEHTIIEPPSDDESGAPPPAPVAPPPPVLVVDSATVRLLNTVNKHIYLLQSAKPKAMIFNDETLVRIERGTQFHNGIQLNCTVDHSVARRLAKKRK